MRDPRPTGARAGERGQALALFTLAMTALLAAAGLVVDGGLAFINRRDAQNAADLGAMAGTRIIADFHTQDMGKSLDVWDAIDGAVQANGCTPGGSVPCTWSAMYLRPAATGRGTRADHRRVPIRAHPSRPTLRGSRSPSSGARRPCCSR